jgi:hypothetical protein
MAKSQILYMSPFLAPNTYGAVTHIPRGSATPRMSTPINNQSMVRKGYPSEQDRVGKMEEKR